MTWTKLGDEFLDNALDLSDAAHRTHVEALMYSNRRLLDLLLPKRELHRFAGTSDPESAAVELVESGWWQDTGDAWYLGCRFAHWQQEKVQVENKRKSWAERQRRQRLHRLGDHSLCLESCDSRRESESESRRESRSSPVTVTEAVTGTDALDATDNVSGARDFCDTRGCEGSPTRLDTSIGSRLCKRCKPDLWVAQDRLLDPCG